MPIARIELITKNSDGENENSLYGFFRSGCILDKSDATIA